MSRYIIIFSLILISNISLLAQDQQAPAIPPVNPDIPAINPGDANPPAADLNQQLIVEDIEYIALSGNDLAALYRKYTGRRVIVSSAAAKAEFEFIQPASAQNPLTYAQAAALLKKAATIENFIFVPDATDPNLDFLTLASAGATGKGRGFPLYTETDTLPDGDAVIIYVMNLSYIKPDEAVRTFTQIVGQFGAYGSIAAVPNAASVIITENTSLIRKLIDIKEQIDKPSSQVIHRFIDVKYADVTELATTLNELLGNDQNNSRTASVQRAPQQPSGGELVVSDRTGSQGATSSGEETPVQIKPDARTNRIIAMGRPVDILFVEALIREFDIKTDQRNQYSRKLKFIAVADFLPIAGDALTRAFSGTGDAAANGTAQPPTSPTNNRSTSNRSNTNNFGGNSGFGSNNSNTGSGGSGSGNRSSSSLADPEVNSAPQALIVGRNLLIANNVTNSIIVQGPPAGVEIIDKLLDQIDIKAEQVMISTVFGQLSLGNSTTTGVDWIRAFRGNDNGGIGFSNLGGAAATGSDPTGLVDPITGLVDPTTKLLTAGTFPNQSGLSIYGKIGNSLASYINLLSTSNDFTVLSRPSIFTANNQKGTISSGRRIAIPTKSNQFSGNGVSTNIEYRDVVLKLEVIPLVNSDDEITLQIALLSDDVIGESDPIEGIGQVPIIGTRELLTTVTVPNNQTIILGGLITTNEEDTVTGIPILKDIPGLGRLFSTKTKGVDRDELMIFIQPSIVNNDKNLSDLQLNMDNRYDVSEDARLFADGEVLPPIEEKKTDEQNTDKSKNLRPMHRR
jgi:general secretion pathway protein D